MKIRLSLLILFLFATYFTYAQNSYNGDSLFELARSNAFNGNHALAIVQCDSILNHYPNYNDVKILKARIYSWDKDYATSKVILEKVIADKPDNMEAINAITDNALWGEQYEDVILFVEKGILIDPNNTELLIKKAKAQIKLKRYKDAEKTLATIRQINANSSAADSLEEELKILKRANTVALYNLHDWFAEVYGQRNLLSLEYKRRTEIGPFLTRVNYANRFGFSGFQYEADFYPRLTKTLSGYLNYGFSDASNLFPRHKIGAELFYSFPKKITASLGIRYMQFTNNTLLSYTGSAGIYTGKYWFGFRAYVTPTSQRTGQSVYLFARRFFKDEFNYLTLSIGQGVSPENTTNSLNFDSFYFLNTQSAKLQWVKTLGKRFSFQLGSEFIRLQVPFDSNKYIFQFTLDTGIKYQF